MTLPDIHTHTLSENLAGIYSIRITENSPPNPEQYFAPNEIPNFSVGLHPWDAHLPWAQKAFELSSIYALQSRCLALGECGLDSLQGNLSTQIIYLEKSFELAISLQIPIILHIVKAWPEFFRVRSKFSHPPVCIIHGFRGNESLAKQLVSQGIFFSFGKNLLQDLRLQQVFKDIPDGHWFLETDTANPKILSDLYQLASQLKDAEFSPEKLSTDHANSIRQFREFFRRNGNRDIVF
jgi:TatD DNase family protein